MQDEVTNPNDVAHRRERHGEEHQPSGNAGRPTATNPNASGDHDDAHRARHDEGPYGRGDPVDVRALRAPEREIGGPTDQADVASE